MPRACFNAAGTSTNLVVTGAFDQRILDPTRCVLRALLSTALCVREQGEQVQGAWR